MAWKDPVDPLVFGICLPIARFSRVWKTVRR